MQAYHGHAQALEVLLQGETEVDQRDEAGRTPLALAALRGHTECVHTLLSQGASPRTTDTQHGRTPVHLAGGFIFSLTLFKWLWSCLLCRYLLALKLYGSISQSGAEKLDWPAQSPHLLTSSMSPNISVELEQISTVWFNIWNQNGGACLGSLTIISGCYVQVPTYF